jgi:putative membrane protein
LTYAAAAVALVLYAQGFARLRRRRPTLAPAWAGWCFAAGVAIALAALASPLDRLADERSLTAHMAQHILIGDVAPLLLAAALAGPRALFAVPAGALRVLARSVLVRRAVALVRTPAVSLGVWAAALYTWHVPAPYEAAVAQPALHTTEHACFFAAGLLLWTQVLDRRRPPGSRAAFAGIVVLAGTPLAEALLTAGPLYEGYANRADQVHAGLAMMAEQLATFGTAALLLFRAHVERVSAASLHRSDNAGA